MDSIQKRLGIGVYGWMHKVPGVENVLSFKTQVAQVKNVHAGDHVGYGDTVVDQDMTIAIIPVGYADGYSRLLSNGKGKVWLKGERCPVVGKVCMDMCMIDITGIPAEEGDEVIVFGPGYQLEEFASNAGKITYEVLTGISTRVKRVYFQE